MVTSAGRLTPADSRSVRVLPVDVPAGTRRLRVDLTYAPRVVDDRATALDLVRAVPAPVSPPPSAEAVLDRFWPLRNLLNIAVFDPRSRFRGRWDRNRPGQRTTAVVAEAGSDAGMIDGAVVPGPWRLCLEIHQILNPVDYVLTVEWDAAPPIASPGPVAGPRPEASTQPPPRARGDDDGQTGRWLAGELHVHSEHSDGAQSVPAVAAALRAAGVEFFALTDHNTTSGLRDLPADLPAIPGLELTTFYGHATCLGISGFIPWYDGSRVRPFAEMAAEVHRAGGLVCVAHPFAPPNPLCAGCRWEYPAFSWADADLLEIWNGDRDDHAPINVPALGLWDELLTAGHRIVAVAGADLHDAAHLDTKHFARTLVRSADRSAEAILEGLRRGRVVITAGPLITLAASASGRRWEIGETAVVPRGTALRVHGQIAEMPQDATGFLVHSGRRTAVPAAFDHQITIEQPGWIRCEVATGGRLEAVTNPIYVDVA